MPHLRGVTVHVTDSQGKDLQEWGTQYLRQHTETNRVSAYIQSTTDVSFQISLQPEIPFPTSDTQIGENVSTKKQSRHRRACSADRSTDQDRGEMGSSNTLSSPVRPTRKPQSDSGPDFAFLAVLYLDGRSKPERKIIVYTDPADKDFNSPHGKVAFKHRWVQSANGKMIEHAWVFKEKAIETVFDRLMIEGSQANGEDQDDDALIEAMQSSGVDAYGHTEKEGKVGQIVVELRRIILGEKRTEANYRSHHQEGQDEDVDMGVRPDITHATGFLRQNTLNPVPLRVVDYSPLKPGEVWATFQFFYRSREQLQKFHFPGFPPLPTIAARTTRLLNAQMAGLTPLSISLPLDKKTKEVLPDRDSYEAKVKKRGVKPDGSQKKQDFGSEYRDTQGKKPFENTRADALSPQTSPDTARASLLSGKSRISDPQHKLQPQGQARQSVIPDTDATNIVGTSSSSSPSLSTNITKEQIANVADKDSYRPTPGDSYASDQDGTDELATESDLETHAGDDDPNYSANPNEEDEGYDSLQSQFKNVRVRKRQRDDVEEAEDHNEVWQGDGLAHLDSNGKQKALNTHLTDEERTRQRKKSRTAKTTSAVDSRQDACGDEGTQGAGLAKNVVS